MQAAAEVLGKTHTRTRNRKLHKEKARPREGGLRGLRGRAEAALGRLTVVSLQRRGLWWWLVVVVVVVGSRLG